MSNEIIHVKDGENRTPAEVKPEFKGYTLEELRYQRALVALKKDFSKSKLIHDLDKVRNHKILGGAGEGKMSKIARAGGIATKIFSGLNYLDYAMIGMSLFTSGKKIYKFFSSRKK